MKSPNPLQLSPSLTSSLPSLVLSLTLHGIAGVDAFHEQSDSFENFFRSIYALFAMITFEDWPEVLFASLPLVPTRVLPPPPFLPSQSACTRDLDQRALPLYGVL